MTPSYAAFVTLIRRALLALLATGVLGGRSLAAQQPERPSTSPASDSLILLRNDSVSVRLVEADLRAAVQALAPYLEHPVVFGSSVPGARVTLTTPHPVPRREVVHLLSGLLASQSLELVADSGLYRVQPKSPAGTVAGAGATVSDTTRADAVQLFVIHLHHARAADVAATVNALYGRASALGELGAAPSPPTTLSQQLQATQVPPASGAPPGGGAPVPGTGIQAATFTGDVTIVPDPRSNSLLIRASPHDYALIQAAVQALDTRPLEVLIEVVIAEVQRSASLTFGVGASVPPGRVHGSKTTVGGSQAGPGLSDFVLQVMRLGSLNLDATLSAAASKGEVKILSRPVVIAANNEAATINVGSQRPFIQVSRALPTDQATRDQVVQYKDVGTKLTVRPTISPDGYVVLEVTQEVNNATSEVAFDAPVISTRSVQTELLIKDGQTVALGGLTDRQHDVSQGGVPVLSSIPLIGGLFGHAHRETTETELFLFITPRVIRTDQDADSLTTPFLERAGKEKP
jgi:general secretion pathway protein D